MFGGGIDKIDIRIPTGTALAKSAESSLRHLKGDMPGAVRGTKYYGRVEDLRRHGLRSILYYRNRWNGNHKLEIIAAGTMTLWAILSEVGEVFDVDPMQAEIMRIDLAVDVLDYPVQWFRQNARFAQRRYSAEYARVVSERTAVETLYFGCRPNIVRIYDKTQERRIRYRRLNSKANVAVVLSFEEMFGHRDDQVLTRVERQYGGGRVPKEIGTMQQLQQNGASIDPFEPLRFLPVAISEESISELTGDAFVRGHGVLRLVERFGYHEAKRLLDRKTSRNTGRLLGQLRTSSTSEGTSAPPDLYANYQEAIRRQLTG
jgi:hypothetical protein